MSLCVIARSTTARARAGAHMRTFCPVKNMYRNVPSEKSKSSSGKPILMQKLHSHEVRTVQNERKTHDGPCDHQEDTDAPDTPVRVEVKP